MTDAIQHRICLDVDGVLAGFNDAYATLLSKVGRKPLPAGWQTDPHFPAEWNWEAAAGFTPRDVEQAWHEIIKPSSTFWKDLEPLPTAVESLMMLNGMVKAGEAEVYLLSHRMGDRAKLQTEQWAYEAGLDYPTVILTGDKLPFLRALGATFFVDDRPDTVLGISQARWPGHLVLKKAPYNKALWEEPGFHKASTIKEALQGAEIWA